MCAWSWPTWNEWLTDLDEETRHRAEKLRDDFARRGADDPEGWARSEVSEEIAQMTRYLFLAAVWRRMENAVGDALESGFARSLVEAGADAGTLESVVKLAVYDLAFQLCYLVDEADGTTWLEDGARRSDVEPTDRRWELREIEPDGSLSGRDVGGLHESLSELDPSDGQDWPLFG
jgi:hypothetical protein